MTNENDLIQKLMTKMIDLITLGVIEKIFDGLKVSSMSKSLYINCIIKHFKDKDATLENSLAFELAFQLVFQLVFQLLYEVHLIHPSCFRSGGQLSILLMDLMLVHFLLLFLPSFYLYSSVRIFWLL